MLNNCVLVGRIAHDIELKESENGNKYAVITLAVPRNYKNAQGEYETDFINVNIWKNIAENTAEYCKKGDIVGVRGRMESSQFEKDGKKEFRLNIFADKVSFLSSRRDKVAESRDER